MFVRQKISSYLTLLCNAFIGDLCEEHVVWAGGGGGGIAGGDSDDEPPQSPQHHPHAGRNLREEQLQPVCGMDGRYDLDFFKMMRDASNTFKFLRWRLFSCVSQPDI